MDALALGLYLAWMAAAFGWRTWVQWRRTGDTGLRLHAEPGTIQWWSKLGFVAAIVAGLAAPAAGILGLPALAALDHPSLRALGLVVALLGALGTLATQQAMGVSWRIGVDPAERTGLVTDGVFGLVRNPIFTMMTVTAVGLALMVGSVLAVVALSLLLGSLEAQVRLVEEPYLRRVHGPAYATYAAHVGRFVPAIGRGD